MSGAVRRHPGRIRPPPALRLVRVEGGSYKTADGIYTVQNMNEGKRDACWIALDDGDKRVAWGETLALCRRRLARYLDGDPAFPPPASRDPDTQERTAQDRNTRDLFASRAQFPPPDPADMGTILEAARLASGVTLAEIARRTGMAPSNVSRALRDPNVRPVVARRILGALGMRLVAERIDRSTKTFP